MRTEILAATDQGPKVYKTLRGALQALASGRAYRLAFPAEHPASGWVKVELDEDDPAALWVAQTDVNAVTNRAWAGSAAVKITAKELLGAFKKTFEVKTNE